MILLVILAFIGAGLIGACGPRQFTTLTIYDKPAAFVRLEFDWRVKKGSEHSHPIVLTNEQVAAVLGGVRIEEHLAFAHGDTVTAATSTLSHSQPSGNDQMEASKDFFEERVENWQYCTSNCRPSPWLMQPLSL